MFCRSAVGESRPRSKAAECGRGEKCFGVNHQITTLVGSSSFNDAFVPPNAASDITVGSLFGSVTSTLRPFSPEPSVTA